MKQLSEITPRISGTTSQMATGETRPAATGVDPGNAGSGNNLPMPRQQLAAMRPLEIDKAMEELLPQAVVSRLTSAIHLGPDPSRIGETIDWRIEDAEGLSEDDARQAMAVLEFLVEPADPADASLELAKLRAVMASRKAEGEDESLIQAVFMEQIEWEGYPIDVIRETCRDLRGLTKFWPTWSEFKERCDREFLKRRALYRALRRIVARPA